jgi:hypothetical protein
MLGGATTDPRQCLKQKNLVGSNPLDSLENLHGWRRHREAVDFPKLPAGDELVQMRVDPGGA